MQLLEPVECNQNCCYSEEMGSICYLYDRIPIGLAQRMVHLWYEKQPNQQNTLWMTYMKGSSCTFKTVFYSKMFKSLSSLILLFAMIMSELFPSENNSFR